MSPQEHVTLAPYTTLKVGGVGRYLAVVDSVGAVEPVRQFALQTAVPVLVLGHGSNVLIPDSGFAGLVLINQITGRSYTTNADGTTHATFGAGEDWDAVVADTVERGYWGLENLSHIPGTVGATPIQNVGAYGVEVSERIVSVAAISLVTGAVRTFTPAECQFSYRDSYFKTESGRDWLITDVTFILHSTRAAAVLTYADLRTFAAAHLDYTAADIRAEIISIRSTKFPNWQTIGTAGSYFKNPSITLAQVAALLDRYPALPHWPQPDGTVKVSLGWILDQVCGLRGYTDGAVSLSAHQALVLLNTGDSATAITEFAQYVADTVYKKTHITIEPEVRSV